MTLIPSAAPATRASGSEIVAAVAALPGLPSTAGADRYGPAALTAAWLADFSPHTRRAYFRDLADFLAWCQRDRLDPLTARVADLGQYRVTLEQPGATGRPPAVASVHRRLSALASWYGFLVRNGVLATSPVSGVRRPRVDRDASSTVGLTAAEVRRLLDCAEANVRARARDLRAGATPHRRRRHLAALRDRALLRLLADLGLRVGEALALDTDALTHNRGRRTVRYTGKGNKSRERPLSPHVADALDAYLVARIDRPAAGVPLFATVGRDGGPGRMDEPAAFRLIRRLARQAELPTAERLSPHSLRHAFATNARELGVPLEDVQDAMGHADARTTRRYDRGRYALERDPALRLTDLYTDSPG